MGGKDGGTEGRSAGSKQCTRKYQTHTYVRGMGKNKHGMFLLLLPIFNAG